MVMGSNDLFIGQCPLVSGKFLKNKKQKQLDAMSISIAPSQYLVHDCYSINTDKTNALVNICSFCCGAGVPELYPYGTSLEIF